MSASDDIAGMVQDTSTNEQELTQWLETLSPMLLEQLGEDIELAQKVNPKSWALMRAQGGTLCFFVRNIHVLGIASDQGGIFLDADPDDPAVAELTASGTIARDFDRISGFRFWGKPISTVENVLAAHPDLHMQAVERIAGSVKTHSFRASEHNPRLLGAVETYLGKKLSHPGYLEQFGVSHAVDIQDLQPKILEHVEGCRYWKVDCGTRGVEMPDLVRLGRVWWSNWAPEPIHLDQLPAEHNAFVKEITQHAGIAIPAAEHCWRFLHEMSVGDLIVAIASDRAYGWGEVAGDYEYMPENNREHQRAATWTELAPPHQIANMSPFLKDAIWGFGPRELTYEQFTEAIGQRLATDDHSEKGVRKAMHQPDPDPHFTIRAHFAASGLHYTDAQIATFYTALQTKGFVVLSGISGTGKSKIATGFVEMLPNSVKTEITLPPDDDRMVIHLKPYMKNYHNIHIPKEFHSRFPRPAEHRIIKNLPVQIGTEHGTGRLSYDGATLKKAITLTIYESLYSAMQSFPLDEPFALSIDLDDARDEVIAIRVLPLDESDNLSIRRQSNHLFLSVRPDWRDSTSLLGYYNPLTETYEWTDFLKFLIRAGENYRGPVEDRIAWFVILDEMNLAHVEYYFADLLSVLESGRNSDGWTAEPLRMTYPDSLADEAPPTELRLPPNLYIIGTVNMDETTHAFSPKVLDRAFTIELTDVDFTAYPPVAANGNGMKLSSSEQRAMLAAFSRNGRFVRIDKQGDIPNVVARHPEIRDHLQSLNTLLRRDRFHFGYRVFDEICQYLAINDEHEMMPFAEAFDQAVLMKVLPKFSGSRARLRGPLLSVLAWAIDPEAPDATGVGERFNDHLAGPAIAPTMLMDGAVYPIVARRVVHMLVTLEQDGFVSFG